MSLGIAYSFPVLAAGNQPESTSEILGKLIVWVILIILVGVIIRRNKNILFNKEALRPRIKLAIFLVLTILGLFIFVSLIPNKPSIENTRATQHDVSFLPPKNLDQIKIKKKAVTEFDKFVADGHDIDNKHDADVIIGLADSGDADAEFFMANLMMKNNEPQKAIFMTRMAAENGHPLAQHNLATAYEDGIGGLEKNTNAAKYWYEKAALNGFPPSMSNLANYYHDGEAVEKDLVQAYVWLEMALTCFPYYAKSSEMMTSQFKEILINNKKAIFHTLSKDEKEKASSMLNDLKAKMIIITGY